MSIEFNTREKLRAVIGQIDRLLLSDFPHTASEEALKRLKKFFEGQANRLKRAIATNHIPTIVGACSTANERIYDYLPILGFLLRSTNVRNSFEAYYSLLSLARALLGNDAEFILSSEWDYSPLTYPMNVSLLPKFVLLGLPSSESPNALILPLAGHELGHSVWQNEQLENHYATTIEKKAQKYMKSNWKSFQDAFPEHQELSVLSDDELIDNMFLAQIISEISSLSLCQIEECFCDGIGLTIFGSSYFYAFHYFLAPNFGGYRSPDYPPLSVRARYMAKYGEIDTKYIGFKNFEKEFHEETFKSGSREKYILNAADNVTNNVARTIYRRAQTIAKKKAADYTPNPDAQAHILRMFENGIPSEAEGSISDIVNAGWNFVRQNRDTWKDADRPIVEWVSELILKSIEVLEYQNEAMQC
ncbi:hypothetical protein MnTg02_00830 [bacterium MnTg02]|nr:hypothetical protein MnTg02_00830 [bacterium MnTg02]